jgi:hypothetical protein
MAVRDIMVGGQKGRLRKMIKINDSKGKKK